MVNLLNLIVSVAILAVGIMNYIAKENTNEHYRRIEERICSRD